MRNPVTNAKPHPGAHASSNGRAHTFANLVTNASPHFGAHAGSNGCAHTDSNCRTHAPADACTQEQRRSATRSSKV